MVDNLTKEQRSRTMSKIKSKWTRQERIVHNFLKGNKVKHKMHPKIVGNPDITLRNKKIVVFLHGCFWHKCPKCFIKPKSNIKYWLPKIEKNIRRDKKNSEALKKRGFKVIKIWEHEAKGNIKKVLNRLLVYGKS